MSATNTKTSNTHPRPQAAVMMAAGKGTRMRSKISKVLHLVAGEMVIARAVHAALDAGIERIVIVIGHQGTAVREALEARFPEVDLRWALQAEQKGTAHAVMCAEEALNDFEGDVWILSGDVPTLSANLLTRLHREYLDKELLVTGMRLNDPKSYGRLLCDEQGLYAIREARDCSAEQLNICDVNAGLYRVDARLLFDGLKTIKTDNAQGEYYLTDLVSFARSQKVAIACPVLTGAEAEELEGINDRLDLARAEARVQRKLAQRAMQNGVTLLRPETVRLEDQVSFGEDVIIEEDVSLMGETSVGHDVVIERGCYIRNCHIASGAHIKAYSHCEGAVIGPSTQVGPFARLRQGAQLGAQVKVGNFVEIKKTVLEEGAKASHLSYLGDAHIGKGANIGAGTITCNYDGYDKAKTEIGAGAFIGSDTQLVAPVSVGAGAIVAAGTTVTKDIPDHALALTRPDTVVKDGWAVGFRTRKEEK